MERRDPRSRRSCLRFGSARPLLNVYRDHGRAGLCPRTLSAAHPGYTRGDARAAMRTRRARWPWARWRSGRTARRQHRRLEHDRVRLHLRQRRRQRRQDKCMRRIMPRRGRGGACCGGQGADDQDGVDGAALDGERVEQCADGAAASRTSTPGSQAHMLGVDWAMRPDHLVTVVSTLRLPVVAEMSRGCGGRRARPHAAAAACVGDATRKPSAKQARRRARTCRWTAQIASR